MAIDIKLTIEHFENRPRVYLFENILANEIRISQLFVYTHTHKFIGWWDAFCMYDKFICLLNNSFNISFNERKIELILYGGIFFLVVALRNVWSFVLVWSIYYKSESEFCRLKPMRYDNDKQIKKNYEIQSVLKNVCCWKHCVHFFNYAIAAVYINGWIVKSGH